jgi:hypothetical protein
MFISAPTKEDYILASYGTSLYQDACSEKRVLPLGDNVAVSVKHQQAVFFLPVADGSFFVVFQRESNTCFLDVVLVLDIRYSFR